MKLVLTIFLFLSCGLTGCASSPHYWYKDGRNQYDFDIDSWDCEVVAKQLARDYSDTGRQVDLASYSRIYLQCLAGKGWNQNKPVNTAGPAGQPTKVPGLNIKLAGQSMAGFGEKIALPKTFFLRTSKQLQIGPTVMAQFSWQNKNSTFINVIFQQS